MLLLVVLSLLTLFLLVGTAFLITAKQSEGTAKAQARAAHNATEADSRGELLDEVVRQLVRDTDNVQSSLRSHSLLADMYGNDGFTATIGSVQWANPTLVVAGGTGPVLAGNEANPGGVTAGQLVRFTIYESNNDADSRNPQDLFGNVVPRNTIITPGTPPVLGVPRLSPIEDAYAGQTLTFISAGSPTTGVAPASARGVTTRIVRYRPANISTNPPTPATITVLAFPLANGSRLQDIDDRINAAGVTALRALDGSRILINGRPFNGMGTGLNTTTPGAGLPRLTVQEDLGLPGYPNPQPLSLLPNSMYFNPRQLGFPGSFPRPANTLLEEYLPTGERNLLVVKYGTTTSAARATDAAALLDRVGIAGVGNANESYDAPDFQNLALAMMPLEDYRTQSFIETNLNIANPTVYTPPSSPGLFWVDATQTPPQVHSMVLPSFHRPELLNYFWKNGSGPLNVNASLGGAYQINPVLLRKLLLRPSPLDHPFFSGSNPEFEAQRSAYWANPTDSTNAVQQNLLNRLIYGPWDVDNDKDGVRDSVWVDFGAPVITGPNGKLVKPLAAILCVDLDGRVNVNAAASLDLAQRMFANPNGNPEKDASGNFLVLADNATNVASMPRGSGYGPADISLAPIHGPGDTLRLLTGANDGAGYMPGRYGADLAVGGGSYDPKPGRNGFDLVSQVDFAGWPQFADGQEYKVNKLYRRGSAFANPPDLRTRYGSGIDVFGQVIWESSRSSNELANRATDTTRLSGNLLYDSPYDIDLSNVASKGAALNAGPDGALLTADDPQPPADMPFTLSEFERTQRVYDADASLLPGRLFNLARFFNGSELPARLKITTDSFDVPAPNVSLPPEFDTPQFLSTKPEYRRMPRSFAEILEMRVRESLSLADFPEPLTAADAQRVREIVRQIIAPELARGERLNINRPFGNGRDDNGNGVVDEPYEWVGDFTSGTFAFDWDTNGNLIVDGGPNAETFAADDAAVSEGKVWDVDPNDRAVQQMGLASAANAVGVVPAGGVTAVAAAFFPPMAVEIVKDTVGNDPNGVPHFVDHRQLFARHLYVLALTLTADSGYTGKRTPGSDPKHNDPELARRLAQWAINVVDFRDPDNIMTGFEYDLNPFDGWDVDGNIGTIDRFGVDKLPYVPGAGMQNDDRGGLVWGAERPELLITEAMAWHDRATETNQRNVDENSRDPRGTPSPQDEPHQQFRPRGAFFLELYNPWESTPGVGTDTHVAPPNGDNPIVDYGVNLAAVDRVRGKSPVWRLITYKDSLQANPNMPGTQVAKDPDNPYWNLRPGQQPLLLDRAVYFAGFDPEQANPKWDNDGVAYYNNPNLPTVGSVRPGRYMVVGSGQETAPGSKIFKSPIGRKKNKDVTATQRQVELNVSSVTNAFVRVQDPVNPPQQSPGDPQPIDNRTSMCDIAVIDHVYDIADGYDDNENRTSGPKVRRLTLSEPPDGYKDRILNLQWDPKLLDPETGEGQYAMGPAPHQPTDAAPVDVPLDDFNDKANFNAATSGRRDGEARIPQTPAFIPQFGAVYLQRLANPLLPWNPEPGTVKKGGIDQFDPTRPVNPYLTVDDTLVGLSVFEGHDTGGKFKLDNNKLRESFVSMERGWLNDPVDQRRPTSALVQQPLNSNYRVNLWRAENPWLNTGSPAPANAAKRNQKTAGSDFLFNASPEFTFGFLNRSFDATKTLSPNKDANQVAPFPSYPWNNRPFISGPELALAPRSRSSQLLHDFSMASTVAANDKISPPYATPTVDRSLLQAGAAATLPVAPFAGQENFFYEASGAKPALPGTPSNLYRVFDYLQTPSLFAGTETWLNPQTFSDTQSIISRNRATDPRLALQAPFNAISRMREPGKVNLNTVASQSVWDALFHGDASKNWRVKPDGDNSQQFVHRGPYWLDGGTTGILQSRRGYGPKDAPILTLDTTVPTFFADPFRSSNAADLVPTGSMVQKQTAAGNDLSGVEATLFRSLDPAANVRGDKVLFQAEPRNGAAKDVDDPLRSKVFESSPMTRIANLTTNRSNVYQIWVTVGFFEVEPVPAWNTLNPTQQASYSNNVNLYNRVYPEGYQFGKESTDDSGQTTRMRGYYVIDRSIPVGFEPGQDLNSDQTVRLKRRIE